MVVFQSGLPLQFVQRARRRALGQQLVTELLMRFIAPLLALPLMERMITVWRSGHLALIREPLYPATPIRLDGGF